MRVGARPTVESAHHRWHHRQVDGHAEAFGQPEHREGRGAQRTDDAPSLLRRFASSDHQTHDRPEDQATGSQKAKHKRTQWQVVLAGDVQHHATAVEPHSQPAVHRGHDPGAQRHAGTAILFVVRVVVEAVGGRRLHRRDRVGRRRRLSPGWARTLRRVRRRPRRSGQGSQGRLHLRVVWRRGQRGLKGGSRLGQAFGLTEDQPQVVVDARLARLERRRPLQRRDGPDLFTLLREGQTQAQLRLGIIRSLGHRLRQQRLSLVDLPRP